MFVTRIAPLLCVAAALSACSVAGPRSSPLPKDGPTMVDIYKDHMREELNSQPRDGARSVMHVADDARLMAVSEAATPTVNRFQRLPNPDLEMHVFAHLVKGKYPVPAYVTVFPMYESVQYALPGEVAPRERRAPTTGRQDMRAEAAESTSSAEWMQAMESLAPDLHQVVRDLQADVARQCGKPLTDAQVPALLKRLRQDPNLRDLERRQTAFAHSGPTGAPYARAREKVACGDLAKALSQAERLAAR